MWETRIAPSILSADFSRLADEIDSVANDVEMIHVDVMDGHYVPNITLGPPIVRSIRPTTDRLLDCHLMITDPRRYAPQFLDAGAESVTFHPEVDDDPLSLVHDLRARGGLVGVALKPAHPVSMVDELLPYVDMLLVMTVEPGFGGQDLIPDTLGKVSEAVQVRAQRGLRFRIQVDGGIASGTVAAAARAGADTFVAGSAVFGHEDRGARCRDLRERALAARTSAETG